MYPIITVDIKKLQHNVRFMASLCEDHGITTRFLVTKVLAGNLRIIEKISQLGFTHVADSRIENLIKLKKIDLPKVLLRLPSISDAKRVVKYSDITLNSELETITILNKEAFLQNKIHDIILMFDLGDLREGIFYIDDYQKTVETILQLESIRLVGIGTNLTCYGGIIPEIHHFEELLKIKNHIEESFTISIPIISGGNSSSIPLLISNQLPEGINNLRLGESIFLGRETAYGTIIKGMHQDVFCLQAEIIEIQTKPSYPIGKIGLNSFGEIPEFINSGQMKRAIVSLGKQDVQLENITPIDKNVKIIGGSSDHLILDVTTSDYQLGEKVLFQVSYPGLLQVMTSQYIKKIIQ